MWRYLKEFDKLSKESPGQVLTLHFEDMKAVGLLLKLQSFQCCSVNVLLLTSENDFRV